MGEGTRRRINKPLASAVYPFRLVGSDDDVRERCALFEDEHCVGFACFGLPLADGS